MRFLSECGVDAGDLSELGFHEQAQAGLERSIFSVDPPYLIKDPWFFDYLDKVDEVDVQIEALIIPIRDVREAAASRVLQERTALGQHFSDWPMRSTSGGSPGGSIYSLSIEDQARILAVGQAKLLSWATNKGIQPYLVGFPRLIDDAEYLYQSLSPWITKFVDKDEAIEVHRRISNPSLVHKAILDRLSQEDVEDIRVERDAMARALGIVKAREEDLIRRVNDLEAQLQNRDNTVSRLESELAEARGRLDRELGDRARDHAEHVRIREDLLGRLIESAAMEESLRDQIERLRTRVNSKNSCIASLETRVESLEASRSFRWGKKLTAPGRFVKAHVPRIQ